VELLSVFGSRLENNPLPPPSHQSRRRNLVVDINLLIRRLFYVSNSFVMCTTNSAISDVDVSLRPGDIDKTLIQNQLHTYTYTELARKGPTGISNKGSSNYAVRLHARCSVFASNGGHVGYAPVISAAQAMSENSIDNNLREDDQIAENHDRRK
jgi:hypothetical protein